MTIKEKNVILKEAQILQKIRRMAYQIYERNFQEQGLVLVGVYRQGYHLAEMLAQELKQIAGFDLLLVKMKVDKENPVDSQPELDVDLEQLGQAPIILVDDVLNTGRTMTYCLKPFLHLDLNKLEIAVLVNRSHKQFPISANYQGYELSTTINEHIEVVLDRKQKFAFLR